MKTYFCYAPECEDENEAEMVEALCQSWAVEEYAERVYMRGDQPKHGDILEVRVSLDGEVFWKSYDVGCAYEPTYFATLKGDESL
jgi:hypothetical protein